VLSFLVAVSRLQRGRTQFCGLIIALQYFNGDTTRDLH